MKPCRVQYLHFLYLKLLDMVNVLLFLRLLLSQRAGAPDFCHQPYWHGKHPEDGSLKKITFLPPQKRSAEHRGIPWKWRDESNLEIIVLFREFFSWTERWSCTHQKIGHQRCTCFRILSWTFTMSNHILLVSQGPMIPWILSVLVERRQRQSQALLDFNFFRKKAPKRIDSRQKHPEKSLYRGRSQNPSQQLHSDGCVWMILMEFFFWLHNMSGSRKCHFLGRPRTVPPSGALRRFFLKECVFLFFGGIKS